MSAILQGRLGPVPILETPYCRKITQSQEIDGNGVYFRNRWVNDLYVSKIHLLYQNIVLPLGQDQWSFALPYPGLHVGSEGLKWSLSSLPAK